LWPGSGSATASRSSPPSLPRGERVARFEEHLHVIERLWGGDPVHFAGRFVRLDGQQIALRPLQSGSGGRPPIWIGANADAGVMRAARLGDAWLMNPHGALPSLHRQLGLYLEARKQAGKPPPQRLPLAKELFVAEDRATALRLATPYLEAKYRTYSSWGQAETLPADDAWPEDFTELMRDRFIIGDPDDVVAALRTYRDELGVTDFSLRLCWPGMPQAGVLAAIDLLRRHVLPNVGLRAHPPDAGGLR
jgi:alkanesulfonate monooxygenase SsuD/methylene tetrahydromethanopterin reductase-like flavin-dependent oxidoreductase (luciferase family)